MAPIKKYNYLWEIILLIISLSIFSVGLLLDRSDNKKEYIKEKAILFQKEIYQRLADFRTLVNDTVLTNRLVQARETTQDISMLSKRPFNLFIYEKDSNKSYLRCWNTGIVLPDAHLLADSTNEQVTQLPNGFYYSYRQRLPGHNNYIAYCLILLKSSFFVETDHLKNEFVFDQSMGDILEISLQPTEYPVLSAVGQPLFYLKDKNSINDVKSSSLSVLCKIGGLLLIFLSLYFFSLKIFIRKSYVFQLTLLIVALLSFRICLYALAGMWNLYQYALFDPAIYGSSFWLPSFGDLLINSLLFCWICVAVWNRISDKTYHILKYRIRVTYGIAVSCIFLLLFITFNIGRIIQSLIVDSKISFDVTNFYGLTIDSILFTALGFLVLACISLGFYYLSRILYKYIFAPFAHNSGIVYFMISTMGLLYITIVADKTTIAFYLGALAWLVLYTFIVRKEHFIHRAMKVSSSGTVFWIFIFSISISLLMMDELRKSELKLRKLYVEKIAVQTDPSSERLISIANKYLDNDFFEDAFPRFRDYHQNTYLRDSIKHANYIGYLNNYVTNIYIFDSIGQPLYNAADLTYASLNTIVKRQTRPTSLPDMFFYETNYDQFAYITRRVIHSSLDNHLIGTIFIVSNPKKFSGTRIRPELFKQFNQWDVANSATYQYAIYHNLELTTSTKKYPFKTSLSQAEVPYQKFLLVNKKGYSELWYHASSTKTIVMVRKSQSLLEVITLFSYIFCSFLLLLSLINLIIPLIEKFISRGKREIILFPTIRSQIHGTFVLINIIAFLIVGVATISFFYTRFDDSNKDRLSRTMNIMLNEIALHDSIQSLVYHRNTPTDLFANNELNTVLKRVSDIHGLDVNVYNLLGELSASSQPDVYTRGILSRQMQPQAYYSLLRLRQVEYIQKERVSNLSFTTIYAPVVNDAGTPYAYLSIPFFTSEQELNQEISSFLVTLINLYAFVFLITGLVAIIIANRITVSFTVISNKMRQIGLGKYNEEITWDRNDEIGLLVKEYNRMVVQIQKSADTLARTQREQAWRQMARQVAHEIKNPLTPMKLSLQYLQKVFDEDRPNTKELTGRVATTLVEQIDHLAKIAADFSQFANINRLNIQEFDLHEVIAPLKEMYTKNQDVIINWYQVPYPVHVLADKTQMNRLFTNLFINAIDACAGNVKCIINITEDVKKDYIIININDNGSGISDEMKKKIFVPNFTTKSSGTGLGLAMCKSIVENINGSIWFETALGIGTTFFIKLPVIES